MTPDQIKQRAAEIVADRFGGSVGTAWRYYSSTVAVAEAALREGMAMQQPVRQFLADLLSPEALGHAVSQEVRDRARQLLGQEARHD